MSDFLDRADQLNRLKVGGMAGAKDAFDDVFTAISELQAVHSKAYLDRDNIEILFGAIEMAQIIGKLGRRDPESIAQLRNSMITLIVKTGRPVKMNRIISTAAVPCHAAERGRLRDS